MKTKLWKTIEVGGLPAGGLLSELEKENCYVSSYAKDLINKMPLGKIEKIDLCKMTPAEMGFTAPATWVQILEKIKELGGDICPPEVGPLFGLEDTKQENGSWYYIAMEPITGSGGGPLVFCVMRDVGGKRWLGAVWVNPGLEWSLGLEIVFRLRKRTQSSDTETSALSNLDLERAISIVKEAGYQVAKIV